MNTTENPICELRALSDVIKSSLDKIEAVLQSISKPFPSLDDTSTPELDVVRLIPEIFRASEDVIAAAGQLTAAIRVPALNVGIDCGSAQISTCIRVAIQTHVSEIIREADNKGVHVKDIAKASSTGIDPGKLARVLRLLCTRHIFREVSPDVFTNNRISSTLDTGKSVAQIVKDVHAKHDDTSGFAASIEMATDELMKSSSYLPETLFDPKTASSGEPNTAAFTKAHHTSQSFYAWFDLPGHEYNARRFNMAMKGLRSPMASEAMRQSYDWKSLPEGSVVIDVGGGTGYYTLQLVEAFTHLNYIVQDRESVIEEAAPIWEKLQADAIRSGKVKLQAHNILAPQPVQAPAIFFLRTVLHNWSTAYCIKILRNLRDAAGPNTKLLLADAIVLHACDEDGADYDLPGYTPAKASGPLLANKGAANILNYIMDMNMLSTLNGAERTIVEWRDMLKEAGWQIVHASRSVAAEFYGSGLLAVPA
ncbi:hypothetical protein NM688_g947 [Phlebia brevispora]|uniref:Uncharacterized protein n=1 Tax=Phlebia brevispora TaxID=194682 RepID=A0ACC1TD05_9APHY|nr:hypothetical protein NM688_g947 [Phlebia brevispora]